MPSYAEIDSPRGGRCCDHGRGPAVERGGREVLHGVSLAVASGSVTGLLGPSGCGKTTLMRAIVGVQIVAGGRVTVLGRRRARWSCAAASATSPRRPRCTRTSASRRTCATSPRSSAPGRSGSREAIETVGLAGREGQVVGSLSGGERSRVSLASALLGEPELLVLDEPTVGLDPVLRAELWATFHELAARGHDAAGLESRDGRGERVRLAAADARRRPARAHHAGRAARADRQGRPRPRLPGGDRARRARCGPQPTATR